MVWTIYIYCQVYITLYWLFVLLSKETQAEIEKSRKETSDDIIILCYSGAIMLTILFAPIAVMYQIISWIVGKIIK